MVQALRHLSSVIDSALYSVLNADLNSVLQYYLALSLAPALALNASPLALGPIFLTLREPHSFPKVTLPWLLPLSASSPS